MKNQIKYHISNIDRLRLQFIFKKYVAQGHNHTHRITELYKMIHEAARNEFTEDSDVSLNAFLKECFDNSIRE